MATTPPPHTDPMRRNDTPPYAGFCAGGCIVMVVIGWLLFLWIDHDISDGFLGATVTSGEERYENAKQREISLLTDDTHVRLMRSHFVANRSQFQQWKDRLINVAVRSPDRSARIAFGSRQLPGKLGVEEVSAILSSDPNAANQEVDFFVPLKNRMAPVDDDYRSFEEVYVYATGASEATKQLDMPVPIRLDKNWYLCLQPLRSSAWERQEAKVEKEAERERKTIEKMFEREMKEDTRNGRKPVPKK